MSHFVSHLVLPSLCATSTNPTAEHSSRSTSTNSGLPPIVVICIVASCGTSPPTVGSSGKKTCNLIVTSSLPAGRSSGKNHQTTKVFFVALGSISLYLYIRRLRERTRRNEHREKAWEFKDMKRDGLRPTLKTEGISTGKSTIQISDPVLMTEVTSSPRYPTRAFHW